MNFMAIQFFQPLCPQGTPNLSLFCAKTEIMLQMSGLEFAICPQPDPSAGPKKKVPYIDDDGQTIGDSFFIEQHLRDRHGIDFYAGLPDETRATAQLVTAAIEEQLYWVMLYSRWQMGDNWPLLEELFFGRMPPEMRKNIGTKSRENVIGLLWGHGMGRHTHRRPGRRQSGDPAR
jgi:glutathione S-transferase